MKLRIMIMAILLFLGAMSTFGSDTRYNEDLAAPQDVGGGGNISPQTGSLSIGVTDLSLPGLNGLHFQAARTYSSTLANVYNMKTDEEGRSSCTDHTPADWKYGLGTGWTFSWPFLYMDIDGTGDSRKLNLFWGGSVYELYRDMSDDDDANNIKYYYMEDMKIRRDTTIVYETEGVDPLLGELGNLGVRSEYRLELKNGTCYYFSRAGNLMCIRNPSNPGDVRKPEIWFYYKDHVPVTTAAEYNEYRDCAKIELVIDSVGRPIDFVYNSGEENWLEEIAWDVVVNGEPAHRRIRYSHESLISLPVFQIDGTNHLIREVENALAGPKFTLAGFENQLQTVDEEDDYTRYEYVVYEAPFRFTTRGRDTNYFATLHRVYSHYTPGEGPGREVYKNGLVFEFNQPGGSPVEYTRKFGSVTGWMQIFRATRQYALSRQTPGRKSRVFYDTKYEYYGSNYGETLSEYWTDVTAGGVEKRYVYTSSDDPRQDHLLDYVQTTANNGEFKERVEYTYDTRKSVKTKSLYRDGIEKYTEGFIYDEHNNLVNHRAPNGLVTVTIYHDTFHVPIDITQKNITNGDGTVFDVRAVNTVRESDGKVTAQAVYATVDGVHGPLTLQKITYDEYGNPKIVEDGRGNRVETFYDPELHLFPEMVNMDVTLDGVPEMANMDVTLVGEAVTVRGYKLFNSDGTVRMEWDNDGYAIEHVYDELGTEIKTILPDDGDFHEFDHDLITSASDLLTPEWLLSREGNSFVEMEVNYGDESVLTFGEEFNGIRVKTGKFADGLGHVEREVLYENAGSEVEYSVKQMTYDSLGNMIALVDPDGIATGKTTSVMDTPVAMYDRIWLVRYDDLGRKTEVIYPDEGQGIVRKRIEYDDRLLKVTTTNTKLQKTIETYDVMGNLIKLTRPGVKDENGVARDLTYTFEYNEIKQKIAFTDPLGERVSYSFDERGLMTKLDYSNGCDLMTYDDAGNLVWKKDRNGNLIVFSYDEMNRNVFTEYYNAAIVPHQPGPLDLAGLPEPSQTTLLGYDGRGNLVHVLGTRMEEWMEYDSRGRMKGVDRKLNEADLRRDLADNVSWRITDAGETERFSTRFTYTPNDLVETMELPNGKVLSYTYDETKLRLTGIATDLDTDGDNAGDLAWDAVTDLYYNKAGQVTEMRYGNNTTQYWDFDLRSRIKQIRVTNTGGEILRMEYKVDTENNITAINDNAFAYDALDRIVESEIMNHGKADYRIKVWNAFGTSVDEQVCGFNVFDEEADLNADGFVDGKDHIQACQEWEETRDLESFTYDHNGNRRKLIQNGETYDYIYGERNRLLRVEKEGQPVVAYEYDANGNTVKRTEYPVNDPAVVYDFTYDFMNRLVHVDKDGSPHANYIYDNAGMRLYKWEQGKRTYYFRNGGSVVYEIEIDDGESEGSEGGVTENTYLVSGELIAGRITRKNGGADEVFSYHLDHLNSTKMVSNSDGDVVLEYEYRAFGTELARIGDDENRYSYIGREFDDEIELYYVNARFYDATIGRFINVDPIQDGWNWYVYCGNNPLKFKDPSGLDEEYIIEKRWNYDKHDVGTITNNRNLYEGWVYNHYDIIYKGATIKGKRWFILQGIQQQYTREKERYFIYKNYSKIVVTQYIVKEYTKHNEEKYYYYIRIDYSHDFDNFANFFSNEEKTSTQLELIYEITPEEAENNKLTEFSIEQLAKLEKQGNTKNLFTELRKMLISLAPASYYFEKANEAISNNIKANKKPKGGEGVNTLFPEQLYRIHDLENDRW